MNQGIAKGRCHKFGHDLDMDDEIMPAKYILTYPFEVEKLTPHLFETIRPGFHLQVRPGDFIIAGRNFAKGKPHPQGLMVIAALKLNILCESMPFATYRGAVSRGILCHRNCPGISDMVNDGDTLEYNFLTGQFHNETTGARSSFPPLPQHFLEMMLLGGMRPMLERWRDQQTSSTVSRSA